MRCAQYPDYMRNVQVIAMQSLGVCDMDVLVPNSGDGVLTRQQAVALVYLDQSWTIKDCEPHRDQAVAILFALGVALRIIAYFLLRFLRKQL